MILTQRYPPNFLIGDNWTQRPAALLRVGRFAVRWGISRFPVRYLAFPTCDASASNGDAPVGSCVSSERNATSKAEIVRGAQAKTVASYPQAAPWLTCLRLPMYKCPMPRLPMPPGTLAMLVLRVLRSGSFHGYAIDNQWEAMCSSPNTPTACAITGTIRVSGSCGTVI